MDGTNVELWNAIDEIVNHFEISVFGMSSMFRVSEQEITQKKFELITNVQFDEPDLMPDFDTDE